MVQPAPAIKHTGIQRILKAAGYSFKGLSYAFRKEVVFRQFDAVFASLNQHQ